MSGIKNRDSRQIAFLSYYLDPKSETHDNAYQSALRAGYNERYAAQIVSIGVEWIQEATRKREAMLVKAERNLDQILDLETKEPIVTMIGVLKDKESGEILKKQNPNLLRTKADVSKFVAERIGKKEYGSETPQGGNTYNTIIFAGDQVAKIAKRALRRATDGDSASEESPNRLSNSDESKV